MWWIQLRGTNKNTGKEIDEYGCAVAWLPMLLIENANGIAADRRCGREPAQRDASRAKTPRERCC